jgi:antitoxin (DNA-binding transcriptional repressor) of toxin-antitoxin stability system
MAKASVGDLRYRFSKLEYLLRHGEEIQITKRNSVIARLVPEREEKTIKIPDFMARLKKIYGNRMMKVSGAELIARDRNRF